MMLNESIKQFLELELNLADLYQLFYVKFPEDSEFWWKISLEEVNHAALIRSINDLFLSDKILPKEFIQTQTSEIHRVNHFIRERITQYKTDAPSRFEAFYYAYELENSAGEAHYEMFMNENPVSNVEKIFQKLNGEDKNHALRIENYMKMNNISNTGV